MRKVWASSHFIILVLRREGNSTGRHGFTLGEDSFHLLLAAIRVKEKKGPEYNPGRGSRVGNMQGDRGQIFWEKMRLSLRHLNCRR